MEPAISLLDAALLGIVEGLTEFLPVSSTGHLILTSKILGLDLNHSGVQAFLVVIQAGALLAVAARYRASLGAMASGIAGNNAGGRRLIGLLALAFAPAALTGFFFADAIKERLFSPAPVALALGVGGAAMIAIDRINRRLRGKKAGQVGPEDTVTFAQITVPIALGIGLAQCLALWPGTSRSMVTLLAAICFGLSARTSAEFSFLLALPTLGGATAYDLFRHGPNILEASGTLGLGVGFFFSCIFAALAIHYFIRFLSNHGLDSFGWYRIALAFVIFVAW